MKQLVFALILALGCGAAAAQERDGACREDVQQYCAQAGEGKPTMDCLLDHQKDVSDACYDSLKQRMSSQQGAQACKRDSEQLCNGVQPGGGRVIKCLMEHQKALSDDCYDALSQRKKDRGRQ